VTEKLSEENHPMLWCSQLPFSTLDSKNQVYIDISVVVVYIYTVKR
jgi:hypothetical protein